MSRRAYELRAMLRPLAASRRVRDCGLKVIGDPEIRVQGEGEARSAYWCGVLQCGRQHACPACALRRAAKRAAEIARVIASGGRWQMVTLTLRHHDGQRLATLLDALLAAWRRVRSGRAVREIFDRRVTASARAIEVTRGSHHGWHPHIHLLLETTQWSAAERRTLLDAWLRAVDGDPRWAVKWSKCLHSGDRSDYLSKMGAEVALSCLKRGKLGSRSPWALAVDALESEEGSRDRALWVEYQLAMKGRRMLELDERAKARAGEEAERGEPIRIRIYKEEFLALVLRELAKPATMHEVLEATAKPGDPEVNARASIARLLAAPVILSAA